MSAAASERSDGARALLYTLLGEFVLPNDDRGAWTSTLVGACAVLGIGEKNARQALARLGERGRITPVRHGRRVRWHLTPVGEQLLRVGAERIYNFGAHAADWNGEWLVAHCPVPETRRTERSRLRTQLGFQGFGELSASLMVSPHVERESALRVIVSELGLDDCVVFRSRTSGVSEDAMLAARAWNLDALGEQYAEFVRLYQLPSNSLPSRGVPASGVSADDESAFAATVGLVHEWRRFPFNDPELPRQLLPADWVGLEAATMFHNNRSRWAAGARRWFSLKESER